MTAFEEMGVLSEIGKAIDEMDWTLPTDVQAEAVPLILGGGDVLMAAETGSGKTGAFCLPILQIVWESLKDKQKIKRGGSVGGGQPPTKCAMSFFDRDQSLAINPSGYLCQSRDHKAWFGCRSTKGVFGRGKYYYEAKVTDEGLCRVGWSTSSATLDLGTDKQGFGFGGTGKKSYAKQFDSYGEPYGMHDVIGCYLNLDDGVVGFSKNGSYFGAAFTISSSLRKSSFFASVVLKNAEMEFNFGADGFKYPPDDKDYLPLCRSPKELTVENPVSSLGDSPREPVDGAPRAIIIEPSRELAEQTLMCIRSFKKYLAEPKIHDLLVTGGEAAKDQISALRNGVDIVVGTPGRLADLISTGQLPLSQVCFFVLDEADGLLNQGHGNLIDTIHRQIPKITSDNRRLQMVICSATLHSFEVKKLSERLMHFPTWVDLKGEDSVPETVHHVVCMVDPQHDTSWQTLRRHIRTDDVHAEDKPSHGSPEMLSEAVKILKGEYTIRAINEQKMEKGIIFCRTKVDCDNMENYLNTAGGKERRNPYTCVCLHSDRKPPERKANLEAFKRGEARFLICTDVAARGIDVTGVPYVINVTLPDEKSNYVHRIGRVGRADRMGLAVSLVSTVPEKVWYHSNCNSKGRNCWNTRLTDKGGCCIWYNEKQYLSDIEEHLNCIVEQVTKDLKVPANEFDGKVTYGMKRLDTGSGYKTHTEQMASAVEELARLEEQSQSIFLQRYFGKEKSWLR